MEHVTMPSYKEQKKQWKADFLAKLKVGVILYQSWGYEQTNIDFYMVVDVRGSAVMIQEIGSKRAENKCEGWASDYCVADPVVRIGEPFKKIVRSAGIRMTKVHSVSRLRGGGRRNAFHRFPM